MLSAKGRYSVPCSEQGSKKQQNCSQNARSQETEASFISPCNSVKGISYQNLQCAQTLYFPPPKSIALKGQGGKNNCHNSLPASWRMSGASWQHNEEEEALVTFLRPHCYQQERQRRGSIGKICRWNKPSNITTTLRNASMKKYLEVCTAENKQTRKRQIQSPQALESFSS